MILGMGVEGKIPLLKNKTKRERGFPGRSISFCIASALRSKSFKTCGIRQCSDIGKLKSKKIKKSNEWQMRNVKNILLICKTKKELHPRENGSGI